MRSININDYGGNDWCEAYEYLKSPLDKFCDNWEVLSANLDAEEKKAGKAVEKDEIEPSLLKKKIADW